MFMQDSSDSYEAFDEAGYVVSELTNELIWYCQTDFLFTCSSKEKVIIQCSSNQKLIYTFGNDHNRRIFQELFKKKELRLTS